MIDGADRQLATGKSAPGWATRLVKIITGVSVTIAAGAGLAVTVIQGNQSVRDALKLETMTSETSKLPIKDFVDFTSRCGNYYYKSSTLEEWATVSFICNESQCLIDQYELRITHTLDKPDTTTPSQTRVILEYSKIGDVEIYQQDGVTFSNMVGVKCSQAYCMRSGYNTGANFLSVRFTDAGCAADFKKYLEIRKMGS